MDNVSPTAPTADAFWTYTLQLPRQERAVRIARMTLRAVLESYGMWAGLGDRAELLVSELVTNSVRYSDGPAWMRLRNMENRLRIGVLDTNPAIPPLFGNRDNPQAPPRCRDDAARGRGLLLVLNCADNWGGYVLAEGLHGTRGKMLWVELAHQGVTGTSGDIAA
jgi:anti-sigma regulatory factor (Ser/Thr protein kinase)